MDGDVSNDVVSEQDQALSFAEVTVSGPGVSITRPVSETTMASVIALLFGANPNSKTSERESVRVLQGGREHSWDEETTLGEFILDTGASTFQQKICAAGYYLMKAQGEEFFTSEDVKTALADAHEDMPANFARDFREAASKNYIAKKQGGQEGQFIVPRTGRTAVESKFQDVPKRRTRRTTKKSNSNSSESAE